ncbi:YdcF family protein [Amycolatopsis sp. lyj-346]|uniref:YdcF family protein n=1 Tax=Amycolatopsis sp. lyj-346 TaxID=2789289 RepID=UPI003978A72D
MVAVWDGGHGGTHLAYVPRDPEEYESAVKRQLTDAQWHDAELVWDFHQVHHGISACEVAIAPGGSAVHFRERALELGVPDAAILVEPEAANTGANITLSRDVLTAAGLAPGSVLLISMPYMERRAFATCRRLWPEVEVTCTSAPLTLEEYVKTIGAAGTRPPPPRPVARR